MTDTLKIEDLWKQLSENRNQQIELLRAIVLPDDVDPESKGRLNELEQKELLLVENDEAPKPIAINRGEQIGIYSAIATPDDVDPDKTAKMVQLKLEETNIEQSLRDLK